MSKEIVFFIDDADKVSDIKINHRILPLGKNDLDLYNKHLEICGQERVVSKDEWCSWLVSGTEYYLLFEESVPAARCCVEKYSPDKWEAGDVRCAAQIRGKGLATEVFTYVTKHILENGKTATSRTISDNTAMLRVFDKVGYTKYV